MVTMVPHMCCGFCLAGGVLGFIFVSLLFLRWFIRKSPPCPNLPSLKGKTVLITGGTSAIGIVLCKELVKQGARVIIGVRHQHSLPLPIKDLVFGNHIRCMLLDLTVLDSVVGFVKEYCVTQTRLDVIIHNAGYMGRKEFTADGVDQTMSVNCYGPLLLTLLLREKLQSNPNVTRVVFTSCTSHTAGKIDMDDLDGKNLIIRLVDLYKWFAGAKLIQMLLAREMAVRYRRDGITVYCASPGLVNSKHYNQYRGFTGLLYRIVAPLLFRTPEVGARSILYCASAIGIEPRSGGYFSDCHLAVSTRLAHFTEEFQQKLFDKMVKIIISKGLHIPNY